MKIAIVGAGAIGGWIGTHLAVQGHEVAALARGETLSALRRDGWQLEEGGRRLAAPVAAAASLPGELGPQALVVIALKGPALAPMAASLRPLIGPDTMVMTAMNGIPWWFFDGLDGHAGRRLTSIDPQGVLSANIDSRQVIGAVVHATCSTPAPGRVLHGFGRGLVVGEAVGPARSRTNAVVELLVEAGFDAKRSPRVQREVWYKLWGNMTMNPLSALTGATCDRLLDDDLVRTMCLRAMQEAAAIGERIGCPIAQSGDERMSLTRQLGAFKTSMLQDVEAGKPLEIDALLGAVCEMGRQLGIATPTVDDLLGLSRLFARQRGLYPTANG